MSFAASAVELSDISTPLTSEVEVETLTSTTPEAAVGWFRTTVFEAAVVNVKDDS